MATNSSNNDRSVNNNNNNENRARENANRAREFSRQSRNMANAMKNRFSQNRPDVDSALKNKTNQLAGHKEMLSDKVRAGNSETQSKTPVQSETPSNKIYVGNPGEQGSRSAQTENLLKQIYSKPKIDELQRITNPANRPINQAAVSDPSLDPAVRSLAVEEKISEPFTTAEYLNLPAVEKPVNSQLQIVQASVEQVQTYGGGAIPISQTLESIKGIDFTDTEFAEQAYDWAEDLRPTDSALASDVENWLMKNGALDPSRYTSAAEAVEANGVDTVNGLPVDQFSVMDMETIMPVDQNNPDAGNLTVGEAAFQATYTEYKTGVENGTYPPDSIQADFVATVDAKSALEGGYDLIPYYEKPGVGDSTNRKYPEEGNKLADTNAAGQITYEMGADTEMPEVLNEEAVDAKLEELWNDPTIQEDYMTNIEEAMELVPDETKAAAAAELDAVINSEEYRNTISSIADPTISRGLVASSTHNLGLLTGKPVEEIQAEMLFNAVGGDVMTAIADPNSIPDDAFVLAIKDAAQLSIAAARTATLLTRHTAQLISDFETYHQSFAGDLTNMNHLQATYKQAMIDYDRGLVVDLNNLSAAEFQAAMDRTFVPASEQPKLVQYMQKAQAAGLWGSMTSATMLVSYGYKAMKAREDSKVTAQERMTMARDLISVASVSTHQGKLIGTAIDLRFGAQEGVPSGIALLGLDRTVPQLYGKTSLLPGEASLSQFLGLSPPPTDTDKLLASMLDRSVPGFGAQFAGTLIKAVTNVSDLFGLADVVLGAMDAKKSVAIGDKPMAAAYSLQAVSGAMVFGAGAAGVVGMVAPTATGAVAASSLFLAGAVVGAIALFIMVGVAVHRKNENLQANTETQNAQFDQWAGLGFTQPDYQEKLEYLHYAWSVYGNDNPTLESSNPVSYFDYHQTEWEHFRDTPQSEGTSLYRLDDDLHMHNHLTVNGRLDERPVGTGWGNSNFLLQN